MKVSLSATEVGIARTIGAKRRAISLLHQRQTRRDFTPSGITNDVESAAAEMCVAKALNIYPEWSPTDGEVPKFDLKWYGRHLDVKSTQHPDGNLLIPSLRQSLTYVLVRGKCPSYEVVGAIDGNEVPLLGHYGNHVHKSCWTVQADDLCPINTLKDNNHG